MPLVPLAGYSPHPSAPVLADLDDDAQGLLPDSQSSSVEPQPFRSTSLQALAGTWTIPFNELVGCCSESLPHAAIKCYACPILICTNFFQPNPLE